MIKKIKLHNWKSYKDGELYIDPLTIIIGTNSSGKSNALDALLFLKRIASGGGIFQSINGDVSMPPLRGGIDWVCRKPNNSNSFRIEVEMEYENFDYEYSIEVEVGTTKALIIEENLVQVSNNSKRIRLFYTNIRDEQLLNIPTYFWIGKQGKGEIFELSRNTSILFQSKALVLTKKETTTIVNGLLEQLNGIFVLDPIPSHMRGYSSLSENLLSDGSNIAGVLAALSAERKTEVENTITEYLKKIPEKDVESVWTETIGKFNTDAMLYCKEGWKTTDGEVIDARGMSDGTLRFLAIVTAILTNETSKLLVIEEVDNGLHPSRAHILLRMLKELGKIKGIDIIITTHNPALLDAAGVRMIPFITVAHRDESGQSKLTLLEDIKELPKLISSGNIGELASSGKIESALVREGSKD